MTPRLTLAAAALAFCAPAAAFADAASDAAANVMLYDEFQSCSSAAGFTAEGFDEASPCYQWLQDADAQRDAEGDIAAAGYDCTMDELIMGGHMKWVGDLESWNLIKTKMETCRTQLSTVVDTY